VLSSRSNRIDPGAAKQSEHHHKTHHKIFIGPMTIVQRPAPLCRHAMAVEGSLPEFCSIMRSFPIGGVFNFRL
jgi:hypothetical protein